MTSTNAEWICDDDQTILVRLDGTMGDGDYTVTRSLVNMDGEEFVTKPIRTVTNRGVRRRSNTHLCYEWSHGRNSNGEDEFTGDTSNES